MCTENPRNMDGEHVLFLFTRGMHLGWQISKIETVLTDEKGRTYILLDAEKMAESIDSPLITTEACIVGFISDSKQSATEAREDRGSEQRLRCRGLQVRAS